MALTGIMKREYDMHPTSQGAIELDPKQFERFVRQAYLIVSQTAWLNGPRKSEKLSALPQPTKRTPKAFERQPRYNIRATRPSHPARSGGSNIWDLCAGDRASLHHFR